MSFKEAENSICLQILLYLFSNLPFLVLFIQYSLESLWIQVKNLTYFLTPYSFVPIYLLCVVVIVLYVIGPTIQLYIVLYNSFFFKFYFIFNLYSIVLVLPNIKMNPPQVYMFLFKKYLFIYLWLDWVFVAALAFL